MTEQQQTSGGIELAHPAAMPAPQGGALPTGLEWTALERMAGTLADSDVIPYRLKRKPADVAVILLAAREYGIPPLMALSKLPVVNGTPAPMGELMVALILRAGHRISATFRNPDGTVYNGGALTPQHYGEAKYRRRDWTADEAEALTFTLAEAVTANLMTWQDGKPFARDDKGRPQPWELYTPNMARWRAVANAARLAFADVLMGLSYLPEELGAIVDAEGAPVVGEVLDQQPRRAEGGSLEQRTAQEAGDRLVDFVGDPAVLDNVLRHATENGYADQTIRTPDGPLALSVAIQRRREWLAANTVQGEAQPQQAEQPTPQPGDVDDQGIEEAHVVDTPEAPQEATSAPQEAEQTSTEVLAHESDQSAAYDVAREALVCNDKSVLLTYYQGVQAEGLAGIDVISVLGDDDLHTLGVPPGTDTVVLGALLMAAGKYVAANGVAIRDPQPAPRTAEQQIAETDDPWADGSASGRPRPQA